MAAKLVVALGLLAAAPAIDAQSDCRDLNFICSFVNVGEGELARRPCTSTATEGGGGGGGEVGAATPLPIAAFGTLFLQHHTWLVPALELPNTPWPSAPTPRHISFSPPPLRGWSQGVRPLLASATSVTVSVPISDLLPVRT